MYLLLNIKANWDALDEYQLFLPLTDAPIIRIFSWGKGVVVVERIFRR